MDIRSVTSRREFLKFLAASPILSVVGRAQQGGDVIAAPQDALNVFDFESAARQKLPPAHYGYLTTGVDDDATVRANRAGFSRYQIRSRRLIDVSRIDTSASVLGVKWKTPIILAPAGSQRAFHPEGEIAVARAARSKGHLQVLSTVTTSSIEDVNAARGEPVWFQLYATTDWNVTRSMVKRAEGAGCPVLVFTVDQISGTNRETLRRFERQDTRDCRLCHDRTNIQTRNARRPMFSGLDLAGVGFQPPVTWDYVKRLKDSTPMRLVIKGIVTREDAELAVANGADAIVCSNHGGRAEETRRSSIESLEEVLAGAAGRIPVLVDSGFRRGTDILTALALGASAICVGRPYLWGLAAFGQEGVETVLDILTRELQLAMRYAGTPAIADITRGHVVDRR
jgi:isopentenyl diphosphate isomerase/L-lactate dehydrogenase-like FMN-dependent dehydrogenase